ncbi:unnamed protein product, partial [Musa acuminata subsp. burmannicoides]
LQILFSGGVASTGTGISRVGADGTVVVLTGKGNTTGAAAVGGGLLLVLGLLLVVLRLGRLLPRFGSLVRRFPLLRCPSRCGLCLSLSLAGELLHPLLGRAGHVLHLLLGTLHR